MNKPGLAIIINNKTFKEKSDWVHDTTKTRGGVDSKDQKAIQELLSLKKLNFSIHGDEVKENQSKIDVKSLFKLGKFKGLSSGGVYTFEKLN